MKQRTRLEAIDELRQALAAMTDDEHSICQVAAARGLFCQGFAQWKFGELKELYPQIVRSRPALTRTELEGLANRWQLARQFVNEDHLACDVQASETHFQQCKGWDEFDDRELERLHAEICGEEIEITA